MTGVRGGARVSCEAPLRRIVTVAEEVERRLISSEYADCDVIVTGVCALNVIESLRNVPRETCIVNFGYAGSNRYEIGKTYRVKSVSLHHAFRYEYDEREYILADEGARCLTYCDFVKMADIGDAVLFDMELAFICALGFSNVISFKTVSDNLSLDDYREVFRGPSEH